MKILRRLFLAVLLLITLPVNLALFILSIVAVFVLSCIGWILTGDETYLVDPELPFKVSMCFIRFLDKINPGKDEQK